MIWNRMDGIEKCLEEDKNTSFLLSNYSVKCLGRRTEERQREGDRESDMHEIVCTNHLSRKIFDFFSFSSSNHLFA